jgi:uncharacterized protein YcbX
VAEVTQLSVTPVKGTRVVAVPEIELGPEGAIGNRRFYIVDSRRRLFNGKRSGAIQQVLAACDEGTLRLTIPGGIEVEGPIELGDPVSTRFYAGPRTGRRLLGPFAGALSEHVGQPLELVEAGHAIDRGRLGSVSLISRGSLRRLAEEAGQPEVDARRFRMLIEVDGIAPHEEDGWVNERVRIGAAEVRFRGNVGRCLVTSRDPDSGEIDLPTLDLLGAYRGGVRTTEPLPFGIFGEVVAPGTVRVGDTAHPVG